MGCAWLGSAVDALRGAPASGGRVHDKVRALFSICETGFHGGALRASGIASVLALAGMKVGAGPAETFLRSQLAARGLGIQVVSGDPSVLARQWVAGEIDALWQGAVVPIPSPAAAMSATDPKAEIHPLAGGTMPANAGADTVLPWHPAAARFFTARGVRLPVI